MRKASATTVLMALCACASLAAAQGANSPQAIIGLSSNPSISGHFHCSQDGTIYSMIDGYNAAPERPALLGIHADGSVTNFDWLSVPGYAHAYDPRSVFVGYGHIYALTMAERNVDGRIEKRFVVLTFNPDGSLFRTTTLARGIKPWTMGAFRSGNLALISADHAGHRMALDVIAPDGAPIRQLNLGSEDYLALASATPNGPGKYDQSFLIASSKFQPFGDNLLLVPTLASALPMIETNERGVVRAVALKAPKGRIVDQIIASAPSTLKLRLGVVRPSQHPIVNTDGKQMGIAVTPSLQITEFSLTDGSILHQANFRSSDVQAACEAGGSLHLLTSNSGFFSVTTEQMP